MGVERATISPAPLSELTSRLPAIVRKGLVGLGHAMVSSRLRTAAPRFSAASSSSCARRKAIDFSLRRRRLDDPAHGQGLATAGAHFDRHLVGRTADAARFTSTTGLTLSSACDSSSSASLAWRPFLGDALDGAVENVFGGGLLAAVHDNVHELRQHVAVEFRVREDGAARLPRHDGTFLNTSIISSAAWRRTWSDPACGCRRRAVERAATVW